MMTADSQLLQDYVREQSQDAFTELVHTHLDLVYSAALRQVRSPELAEEISQCVFIDLARAADTLKPDTILTAWLYQVTRRTAIDVVRRESRRQAREKLAVEMAAMNAEGNWNCIEPLLDDAMEALEETDRAAVLLRYFENKSLREVGLSLGTTDDAAQKRVSRAVERLREFFSKRGVTIGASGLIVLVSANAVQSAPFPLATTILAGTAIQTATAIAATKVIAMTALQKTAIAAAIAVLAGAGVYQAYLASQSRAQVQVLRQQQAPLTTLIHQLQQERDDAFRQVAASRGTNEGQNQLSELLQLRAQVSKLNADVKQLSEFKAADSMEFTAREWLARVYALRLWMEQSPNENIPELQFLESENWLEVTKDKSIDALRLVGNDSPQTHQSSQGPERTLEILAASLRNTSKAKFGMLATGALQAYLAKHNGQFPTDLSQLTTPQLSDKAVWLRYEIIPKEELPGVSLRGDWLIAEKPPNNPISENFDERLIIGKEGFLFAPHGFGYLGR